MDKDNANPRVLSTLTDAHCVIKRWTSYQNAWKNVPNMMTEKKSAILCCKMPVRAKTRAHARVRNFFIKCSIWPETYVKKIWDDLEHFKKRTRIFARIFWPEIDWTDIDLNHGKYEWKITFRYEDMIISWFSQNGAWMTSRWSWVSEKSRSSKCRLISIIITSFMIIALFILEISCEQIRGRIIIKINNN